MAFRTQDMGLPAISFQVLQHLMKELNVRESLSGEEKCAIPESVDHRCAFCGGRAKRMEFDHIVRHSESFGAAPECQVLCQPCHQLKTSNEARNLEGILFSSCFSKRAWSDYVESERIPPLVFKHRECVAEQCLVADVRRCRRRAPEYNPISDPSLFTV